RSLFRSDRVDGEDDEAGRNPPRPGPLKRAKPEEQLILPRQAVLVERAVAITATDRGVVVVALRPHPLDLTRGVAKDGGVGIMVADVRDAEGAILASGAAAQFLGDDTHQRDLATRSASSRAELTSAIAAAEPPGRSGCTSAARLR